MKEPYVENKKEFLDKFYEWYLKDLALDLATKASDFLIKHLGEAHELNWIITNRFCEETKVLIKCLVITAQYHTDVEKTIIKTRYECGIDLPE